MTYFAFVVKEGDMYVAKSYEGIASQGYTPEEAISNLKEAVELYYEDDQAVTEHEYFVTSFSIPKKSITKYDKISV